jgi:hypothetical protein
VQRAAAVDVGAAPDDPVPATEMSGNAEHPTIAGSGHLSGRQPDLAMDSSP